ncbi:hypothetical protein DPMN_068765 [Dreissena polymorpha]|uniref:Uncharacterized protein n=1 Tax=Dreissena polymorpha TaxID=45954 RepID=A0A9D3YY71_DREPO|nr:hypothetical protein DPMN_068765 [Dreissena polymorpha]
MGPCIVEIDRIVIREVQYQFEEEIVARTDGQTDRRTDAGDYHNIPKLFKKPAEPVAEVYVRARNNFAWRLIHSP